MEKKIKAWFKKVKGQIIRIEGDNILQHRRFFDGTEEWYIARHVSNFVKSHPEIFAKKIIAEKRDACTIVKEEFGANSVESKDSGYVIKFDSFDVVVRKYNMAVKRIDFYSPGGEDAKLSKDFVDAVNAAFSKLVLK